MKLTMTLAVIAALAAATSPPWMERYFGVGSATDAGSACDQARDHAQGNSFRACIDRRGTRSEAVYTDCTCSSPRARLHVCNVNLKVTCAAPSILSDEGGSGGGKPRGRADRRSDVPKRDARASPPGPEALRHLHGSAAGVP